MSTSEYFEDSTTPTFIATGLASAEWPILDRQGRCPGIGGLTRP
jgi:hypothetical protein